MPSCRWSVKGLLEGLAGRELGTEEESASSGDMYDRVCGALVVSHEVQ